MKIPDIILSKSAQFAREARRIAKQKQTDPLAAESGGIIGDTFEIRNYSMKLKKIWIKEAEKEEIIECLRNKMTNRPEGVQTLYQMNIDFVNKKLNKENYIDKLDCLLMSPQSKGFGCELDEGERIFVGGYSIFFDLNGADFDAITKKDILSYMAYLI